MTLSPARKDLSIFGLAPMAVLPDHQREGIGSALVRDGLDASPTTEVLIEESLLGWKEYEMEVVRDRKDNCIIICAIENVDPMGVHTGDSITVAPALTLTDKEYQIMRTASINVLREIGVETGGSNVQFAVNPADGRLIVIEMNPRVSRSSALASKATGFPIARVAARCGTDRSVLSRRARPWPTASAVVLRTAAAAGVAAGSGGNSWTSRMPSRRPGSHTVRPS